ncbi:MAG TPA: hypothetical protein VME45_08185 [Stellaceae bacterium]|nr:hypothetical protein [Stellaceae bacterium]
MMRRFVFVAVCSAALTPAGPALAAAQPNEAHPAATIAAPLPAPLPGAPVPPAGPMVTSALLPGHWQLDGAQSVWIPPDKEPRPVENRPAIEGRYVYDWDNGEWVWVPPHYGGD